MKINIHWPATNTNDLAAGYVIVWRTLFMPLIYLGLLVTWVGCAFAHGLSHANAWWRNATYM